MDNVLSVDITSKVDEYRRGFLRKNAGRSNKSLFDTALTATNQESVWDAIRILQLRKTDAVFKRAMQLANSKNAKEKRTGIDILSQLVREDNKPIEKFFELAFEVVIDTLKHEKRVTVISTAAYAAGHMADERAIPYLINHYQHNNASVRYAVTVGLLRQYKNGALEALIKLSMDEDDEVRDWATFGLGQMQDDDYTHYIDTPKLRKALKKRLKDPNEDVIMEAMLGLAYRKDKGVIKPLLKEVKDIIKSEYLIGAGILEVVKETAEPCFYPILLQEYESGDYEGRYSLSELKDALEACKPKK